MAVEWKRDWPLVAAGGAAVVGLVLVARGGRREAGQELVRLGPAAGDYQAQVQAQVALEQTRLQTQGQLLSVYTQALIAREQTAAQLEAARLQAQATMEAARLQAQVQQAQISAQLQAQQAQAAAQSQAQWLNFAAILLPFLFSEETTWRGLQAREVTAMRERQAYALYHGPQARPVAPAMRVRS